LASSFERHCRGLKLIIDFGSTEFNPASYALTWKGRNLIHTLPRTLKDEGLDLIQIATADLEALIVDRKFNVPYLIQYMFYNHDMKLISRVLDWNDYNNDSHLMMKAFWKMFAIEGKGKMLYFHNWAGYDAYHLLNPLIELAHEMNWIVKPLLRKGKIIHVVVFTNSGEKIFEIKDSILIVPGSLGNLAKSFNLEVQKDHFPHYFDVLKVNKKAHYIGPWPAYECFESKRTSLKDYQELIAKYPVFDFMAYSRQYLHNDCFTLLEILRRFFSEIKDEFEVDPMKNLTIPSIAFKTWRTIQLDSKKTTIVDFSQSFDEFFRESYLGAIVDVYKPLVHNAFYYDVNSLYPTAMTKSMPTGNPIFGNVTIDEFMSTDWYGYVKATVQAPKDLFIGLLPIRMDGKLISPIGTFTGSWLSDELKFALNHGYKLLSIAYGYKFERTEGLFSNYINKLNQMKIQAQLDNKPSKRNLAKLMMNSSYGRFGLNVENAITNIFTPDQAKIICTAFPIIRSIPFTNGNELIEYTPIPYPGIVESGLISKNEIEPYINLNTQLMRTNVPIAAAVTAYSRMIINEYKIKALNLGIDVIYSDTDSLVVNNTLPQEWLSETELGKFKLEHTINTGYFLAPKLYHLICNNGKGGEYFVSKNKGYSGKITTEQAIELYSGKSLELTRQQWNRDWKQHTVWFNFEHNITINAPFNKRIKEFSIDGQWIGTKPLVLNQPICTPIEMTNQPMTNYDGDGLTYFNTIQSLLTIRNMPIRSGNKKRSTKSRK
jgi:hypothetical protein